MRNFKNNFRRNRFKSNGDRNFRKRNGNGTKHNGEFSNSLDFKTFNLILFTSKVSLSLPLRIFPDGNFNFCEFTFFPFIITS